MKALLVSAVIFIGGFALLQTVPNSDIVPAGVRAVLDDVDSIW